MTGLYSGNDFLLGEEMRRRAQSFIDKRFPSGWGGCAVLYTEEGQFLISVAFESDHAAAGLCMETGALCEAQKYNLRVTHSMALMRQNEREPLRILTACGFCRERLRYWGGGVKVAVTQPTDEIRFLTLDRLEPYYWMDAYRQNGEA